MDRGYERIIHSSEKVVSLPASDSCATGPAPLKPSLGDAEDNQAGHYPLTLPTRTAHMFLTPFPWLSRFHSQAKVPESPCLQWPMWARA